MRFSQVERNSRDERIRQNRPENPRKSFSKCPNTHDGVGRKVGLSTTPVTERVRRLERDNFITGYHARLNPHQLGQSLLVFVELKLRSKSGNIFEDFRREITRIPANFGMPPRIRRIRLPDQSPPAQYGGLSGYVGQYPAAPACSSGKPSYVVMEEVKETAVLDLE